MFGQENKLKAKHTDLTVALKNLDTIQSKLHSSEAAAQAKIAELQAQFSSYKAESLTKRNRLKTQVADRDRELRYDRVMFAEQLETQRATAVEEAVKKVNAAHDVWLTTKIDICFLIGG